MLVSDSIELSQNTGMKPASKLDLPASQTPSRSSFPVALFALAVIAALTFGWQVRDEYLWSAEFGLGYALGIIGGSIILLVLIYPIMKRFYPRSLFIFSTKTWFKIHMALGILGPLLILYHCNFSLGSTNSNVTLASMLLMVTSGLTGRFIYSKIHYGLFGKKIKLKELQTHKILVQNQLVDDQRYAEIFISDALTSKLQAFDEAVLKHRGLLASFSNILCLGLTTRWDYYLLIRHLRKDQQNNIRYNKLSRAERRRYFNPVRTHIAAYLSTVREIAGLGFYERLFSLWHMLHMPLFFMVIVTGFAHVYAVHAY